MLWSVYDLSSGLFTGAVIRCFPAERAAQLKPGFGLVLGVFDPLSQRVDISVSPPADQPDWQPPVIDYQPPSPGDDQWQTWTWDAGQKRWVSSPTLAAIKRAAKQRMTQAWNDAREAGVTIGGKVAPTDADAWTRYLALKQMANDGGWVDVPIPLIDGTFQVLTQAQANALWSALKTMERDLLGRLRDRIEAISNASTAADVAAVVW